MKKTNAVIASHDCGCDANTGVRLCGPASASPRLCSVHTLQVVMRHKKLGFFQ